ncbi:MAG: HAD-IIB family hydrolase [Pseudomonadales bacterium]|nr:HAD-IIB family hydrolase [Pseudomonadales bacterium]
MKTKLVVFTDLDGTLLDHDTYSWQDAQPALTALAKYDCPVILNSSKTRAEIQSLRIDLDNNDPFIVENGSAVCIPAEYFESGNKDLTIKCFGPSRDDILNILKKLRADYGYDFVSFQDMSVQALMDVTGLDQESARKAKQREASEPLLWHDSEVRLHSFISRLRMKGYTVVSGGRFHHVMGTVSKADSIDWLMNAYRDQDPDTHFISVGLGDSFNDVPMLETVDIPVLIAGKHGKEIQVRREDLIKTQAFGPQGWNQAMLDIIERYLLSQQKGAVHMTEN